MPNVLLKTYKITNSLCLPTKPLPRNPTTNMHNNRHFLTLFFLLPKLKILTKLFCYSPPNLDNKKLIIKGTIKIIPNPCHKLKSIFKNLKPLENNKNKHTPTNKDNITTPTFFQDHANKRLGYRNSTNSRCSSKVLKTIFLNSSKRLFDDKTTFLFLLSKRL